MYVYMHVCMYVMYVMYVCNMCMYVCTYLLRVCACVVAQYHPTGCGPGRDSACDSEPGSDLTRLAVRQAFVRGMPQRLRLHQQVRADDFVIVR